MLSSTRLSYTQINLQKIQQNSLIRVSGEGQHLDENTLIPQENVVSEIASIEAPQNDSGYYIACGSCKSIFVFPNMKDLESAIGSRGTRVKCSVCDKHWFQSLDKVGKLDKSISCQPITKQKAEEMKKFIIDNNWARSPRGEKIDLFIGNLPYNFDENDITDLFAEYGVVSVSVVRDADKQPKGFAFVELSSRVDADLAVKEMNGFYLDNSRKLVVKPSERKPYTPSASTAPRGPYSSDTSKPIASSSTSNASNAPAKNVWVPKSRT